jgi:hypothetical protein
LQRDVRDPESQVADRVGGEQEAKLAVAKRSERLVPIERDGWFADRRARESGLVLGERRDWGELFGHRARSAGN